MSNKEKFLKLVSEDDDDTLGWAKDKSREHRIDEILKEHIPDTGSAMSNNIRKAMEQYGKEVHADGMREGHSHGIVWAEKYLPELINLGELVKAQKELIAIYEKAITLGEPDVWELYLKIKQLES